MDEARWGAVFQIVTGCVAHASPENLLTCHLIYQLAKAVPATPCHGHGITPDLGEASRWPWSLRGRRLPFSQRGKTRPESGHVPLRQRPRRGGSGGATAVNHPAGGGNGLLPPRTGTRLRVHRTIHPGH